MPPDPLNSNRDHQLIDGPDFRSAPKLGRFDAMEPSLPNVYIYCMLDVGQSFDN